MKRRVRHDDGGPPGATTRARSGAVPAAFRAGPVFALLALFAAGVLSAQEPARTSPNDIDALVREGAAEALEARLRGGRTPDEIHQLARAYANHARAAPEAAERLRSFTAASQHYRRWIEALEAAARFDVVADAVRIAAARVEHAGTILSGPAAGGLDDYEVSGGRWGDRSALLEWLGRARGEYERAAAVLGPLRADPPRHEEALLAAGLYDTLLQAGREATLNLGWTMYYLGLLSPADDVRRAEHLAAAGRCFQELVDRGQDTATAAHGRLGLGMTQRELGRLSESEKTLAGLIESDAGPALAIQARYELGRCQIRAGRFDEARATLRPLVEKDADHLPPEEQAARLYVNLARLWDANSFLVEAAALRGESPAGATQTADSQPIPRLRAAGLTRFRHLARQGGVWPALVQLYVAAGLDPQAPPRELSTVELLFAGRALLDDQRYDEALPRLVEAAARKDADRDLAGDVLFELGRCRLLLKDERAAAGTFLKLATELRGHPQAPHAATLAYQLWGEVAEQSGSQADYRQLADALRNLLASFADHPQRDEAAWLLPVALQRAGDPAAAADEFARVPRNSHRWEEAQYRQVVCRAKAAEALRGSVSRDEYRRAVCESADALIRYADDALARASSAAAPDSVTDWSAEARLTAAELLASPEVGEERRALAAVSSFETQHPRSELLGRALALRIQAYRGLREFEQASAILAQFLQTASPEQVGPTLTMLAAGMQEEVERLLADAQDPAARALARDAVPAFDELAKWAADRGRAETLEAVSAGRARMLHLAGRHEEAERALAKLLEKYPQNGNYRHLQAQILTAQLGPTASPGDLRRAQDAWAALLSDPAIRQRAPERYWEARYNWLALALRLGQAADVEKAISQERVWRPDLGGDVWRPKFEALLAAARKNDER